MKVKYNPETICNTYFYYKIILSLHEICFNCKINIFQN